jgi:cellulose synthase/poly-beta-1,6-N-acetylglucosamine synthase-like glycosyltransferase
VVRHAPDQRGKGFALAYGTAFLATEPPSVVVILDADCTLDPGALDRLVNKAATSGRPVQAALLADLPPGADARQAVSAFAYRVKDVVRPLGLARLGLPCLLMGTGMALPWSALAHAQLASGNIVEDMQLGLDLAAAGLAPLYCPEATARSALPTVRRAAHTQRLRWEHGHMQTLLRRGPRLLMSAIYRRRLDLAGLALELCVPPLTLLLLICTGTLAALAGLYALGASALPAVVLAIALGLTALTMVGVWLRFGRKELPLRRLAGLPGYILTKVPIYLAFVRRPQQEWVRTERGEKRPITSPTR